MSSVSLGQAPAAPEPAPAASGTLARGDGPLRLMAVHAHPDDESSKGAATMARYVREGVDVLVCTLTGGERGDILNKAMDRPEIRADLPGIRRAEMAMARDILGVRQQFLGFVDSGLPEGDPLPPLPEGCFALQPIEVAARPLVQAVREFRPHVILTYDENGGYPHPDHIMTHRVSVEAFEAAADPDRYPDCGEPWQPLKLYYFVTFHRARFTALHEKMIERGLESAYADRLAEWADEEDEPRRAGVRDHDATCRAPTTSRSGTRRCSRTQPRSIRTAAGSPARSRSSGRRGRPRIITWPGRWWILTSQRTISSPVSERRCGCDGSGRLAEHS